MRPTLQGRILDSAQADPARPCLAFVDARGRFRWSSREEVLEHAGRAAAALADLGLEAGQVGIAVSVDPNECAVAFLAMLLRGAVPLLVAPPAIQGVNSSLKDVVLDVARRAEAQVVLLPRDMERVAQELTAVNPGLRVELGFERLLAASDPSAPTATRSPNDVAALQLTSGTTGFPRIAVWHQQRVLAALEGMARGMGVSADDVYLNWTPLYHDMGLVNNYLMCLVHGIPLALLSPLDVVRHPALWLKALDATGATTTWSPNFGFALAAERVQDGELEGVHLDRVRGFWNAAERVHLDTFERFHRRFERHGVRWDAMKTNFGCVETIGGVTFTDPARALVAERIDSNALQEEGVARVVPEASDEGRTQFVVGCGRAYPGCEIEIFDEAGQPLPDGVVGEIGFETAGRFVEYLGQPDETANTLRGERVFPGDLGYKRGQELFWTGRARERINLQGRMLDPSELERVVFATDGLRKGCFVAFGLEDAARGTEVLVVLAEVELAAEAACARIAAELRRAVATGLGVTIEELALVRKGELTKTSSGKRRHQHFRKLYQEGRLALLYRTGAGRI